HKHSLFFARIEYRLLRDDDLIPIVDLQIDIGKHLRLQLEVGIEEFHTHFDGPGRRINRWINKGHAAIPGFSWVVAELHLSMLAHSDEGGFIFENVRINPNS